MKLSRRILVIISLVTMFTCAFTLTASAATISAPKVETSNVLSSGKIKLEWKSVKGAEKYKVYRATSKSGKYKLIKTTTSKKYTNTSATAGKKYYYYVRAVNKKGKLSPKSKVVSEYCNLKQPTIKTVTYIPSGKKVKLTWGKIDKAASYKVYRATSKNGKYKLIKTTKSTSYTNTGVTTGKTYYYKVKAVASNSSANSAMSAVKSVKAKTYKKYYVLTDRIYSYPTAKSDKTKRVPMPYMAEFELIKTVHDYPSGKWYQIRYEGDILYLWVEKGDKKFTDTRSSFNYTSSNPYAQKVVNLAKDIALNWKTYYTTDGEKQGIKDSKGRYGFDCSGYVTYCINTVMQKDNPAYRLIGNVKTLYGLETIYNGGYTGEFKATKDIDLKDIQPGDLIFLEMTKGKGLNHIGIYLGNGELAHISGEWEQGVMIMPLEGTFEEKVVDVQRFIPEKVVPANEVMYAEGSWCYLYKTRSDNKSSSNVVYNFKKNDKVTVLFTNSAGNWTYVKASTPQGIKYGFVPIKALSKTEL